MSSPTGDTQPRADTTSDDGDVTVAGGEPDAEAAHQRADLLPEELSVGSDDPEGQAEIILEDSLARTEVDDAAPTTHLERRTSEDTV